MENSAALIRKDGKMCRQEFKKQMASNAFGNAVHTSQAKQSGFLLLFGFWWVVLTFFRHSLTGNKTSSRRNCCFSSLPEGAGSESCLSPALSGAAGISHAMEKKPLEFSLVFS